MNRKSLIRHLVAVSYLIAGTAAVRALDAQAIPRIQFEKYKLPNGLEVILHEDHSTPIVAVDTWYHVGSGDELVGRTGFAHLFEHIMSLPRVFGDRLREVVYDNVSLPRLFMSE